MTLTILLLHILVQLLHTSAAPASVQAASGEVQLAKAALRHVMSMNCDTTELTSPAECRVVQLLPSSAFRVLLAPATTWARYKVKLVQHRTFLQPHDAVVVLDPYPSYQFGHLVFVFVLDIHVQQQRCTELDGTWMGEGRCLSPAVVPHCRTSLNWRNTEGHAAYRHCEHHFVPLVLFEYDNSVTAVQQKLLCHSLPGFAPCPAPYPFNHELLCSSSTSQCPSVTDVTSHCPLEHRCDQAVVLAGGWNSDAGLQAAERNVLVVYRKLRALGYEQQAVQTFFADGRSKLLPAAITTNLHAAAGMKVAFQQHIQRLCHTDYCLSNLLLYLHSPAMLDGSLLLWDSNADSDVSRDEEYSSDELLADLAQCKARRIVIFLDQNFAERVARKLQTLEQVTIVAASAANQYVRTTVLVDSFFANHSHLYSAGDLAEKFASQNSGKAPLLYDTTESKSVFGNDFDASVVAGCQSLPTNVILQRLGTA